MWGIQISLKKNSRQIELANPSQNFLKKAETFGHKCHKISRLRQNRGKGTFTYDVRFLGRSVGQAASDFTKQAYVVGITSDQGR